MLHTLRPHGPFCLEMEHKIVRSPRLQGMRSAAHVCTVYVCMCVCVCVCVCACVSVLYLEHVVLVHNESSDVLVYKQQDSGR